MAGDDAEDADPLRPFHGFELRTIRADESTVDDLCRVDESIDAGHESFLRTARLPPVRVPIITEQFREDVLQAQRSTHACTACARIRSRSFRST